MRKRSVGRSELDRRVSWSTPAREQNVPPPPRPSSRHQRGRRKLEAPAEPTPALPAAPVAEAEAQLKITVFPYGDVWVDGKRLGQAPVTIKLEPGTHEVGVGDGRPREKRSITLGPGEKANLDISRRDVGESAE